MTNYYYLASDQLMKLGSGSIDFTESDPGMIPGFDYPIQLEVYNGIEKHSELRELLQYIHNHMARYEVCTVQIANLLNSNLVDLRVHNKYKVLLDEITDPKQLLLQEGDLLTIEKQ